MDPSTVANTLTQMAELKYHAGDTITAEQLLLSAVGMTAMSYMSRGVD